jgi:Leucine Rich repeat
MAFKLGHGMGLAFVIAAAGAGCDAKPQSATGPASVRAEKAPKSPTTASAPSSGSVSVNQPAASGKTGPESPADRIARLGGKVEREGSTVTRIDFFGTQIEDGDLEVLRSFPDLQSLSLSGTKVTDAGLAHLLGLAKLRTLSLGFTDITDRGLITLAKLPELQDLDLLRTKVTSGGIAELQKTLPRLSVSSK